MQTNHPIDPPQQHQSFFNMKEKILQDAKFFVNANALLMALFLFEFGDVRILPMRIKMKIPPATGQDRNVEIILVGLLLARFAPTNT